MRAASCEVQSIIRFLRARGEGLADIQRQISAVYGVPHERTNGLSVGGRIQRGED